MQKYKKIFIIVGKYTKKTVRRNLNVNVMPETVYELIIEFLGPKTFLGCISNGYKNPEILLLYIP